MSNVRFQMPMLAVRRVLGSSARLHRRRPPSATPGPVLSVGSLCARHLASEAPSFLSRHQSSCSWQLRCEPKHNVQRSAQSVCKSSSQGCGGLPVLRRSVRRSLAVAAAQIQARACAPACQACTLVAMQFVSTSSVGSASHQATQAHLRSQFEPNHSVKRTCLRQAAYLKR
jgi:hypothetical protein